jgi:hypothetical protein
MLRTPGEEGAYSWFAPKEQQLLGSGHLRLVYYHSRWVRFRG